MTWMKPPWRDESYGWPYGDEQFLAAVVVKDNSKRGWGWAYYVMYWGATGLESEGGSWVGPESDVRWVAEIPEPEDVG